MLSKESPNVLSSRARSSSPVSPKPPVAFPLSVLLPSPVPLPCTCCSAELNAFLTSSVASVPRLDMRSFRASSSPSAASASAASTMPLISPSASFFLALFCIFATLAALVLSPSWLIAFARSTAEPLFNWAASRCSSAAISTSIASSMASYFLASPRSFLSSASSLSVCVFSLSLSNPESVERILLSPSITLWASC